MSLSPLQSPWSFKLIRRLLPLIVSYAMTINKSQGQSLQNIRLYFPKPVFGHGQLYVAFSRVQSKVGLKILIHDKEGNPLKTTMNVVSKEVFHNLCLNHGIYNYSSFWKQHLRRSVKVTNDVIRSYAQAMPFLDPRIESLLVQARFSDVAKLGQIKIDDALVTALVENHKNLDEYVDNRQEIDNLPDIELWTLRELEVVRLMSWSGALSELDNSSSSGFFLALSH
ncbi:hypothetical protein JHK82_055472 [Glycine max]|nr:hypothetical protein JHK84_055338 [Glycine max]KAG5076777.1 hypothetical protein JHK82_055472 [Glycine max]